MAVEPAAGRLPSDPGEAGVAAGGDIRPEGDGTGDPRSPLRRCGDGTQRGSLKGAAAAGRARAMAAGAQEIASGPAPPGGQGAAAVAEPSPRVATGVEAGAGSGAAPPGGCGAKAGSRGRSGGGGSGRLGAAWARRLCPAGATPGGVPVPVPAPWQQAGTRHPRWRREREQSSGERRVLAPSPAGMAACGRLAA